MTHHLEVVEPSSMPARPVPESASTGLAAAFGEIPLSPPLQKGDVPRPLLQKEMHPVPLSERGI